MFLFAMMLAAEEPAFDPAMARKVCEADAARRMVEYPKWSPLVIDDCVVSQRSDYRRYTIIAKAAPADMAAVIRECRTHWTRPTGTDWGMIEFCATGNMDGRRDLGLLRAQASIELRIAIDKCVVTNTDEGMTDWSDAGDCAREQAGGHREWSSFRATATTAADRTLADNCRIDAVDSEGVVDWEEALNCVMKA